MHRFSGVILLAFGLTGGAAGGYWFSRPYAAPSPSVTVEANAASSTERKILYYRDPSGAPNWSAEPKKDAKGRDYVPVYEAEEIAFGPGGEPAKPKRAIKVAKKLLYYRNPMGLADTSPVPKKDSMGMDYIPVYQGDEQEDGKTVRVSLDKIQRSGVRTETVGERTIVTPVRGVGTAKHDEALLTVVTTRSDGFIEELFVNRTGQHVQAGEPLFRIYSPDIVRAQIDLSVSIRSVARGISGTEAERTIQGAMQQLRNLGVPEGRIREIRETAVMPRTLDWLSPATGDVIEKNVINGQRVKAGDELFRIADHFHLWVIADVAESDLPLVKIGTPATVTFRSYPNQPIEAQVTFIYPELRMETRTARVRIDAPNPDGKLKIDMFADVVFRAHSQDKPMLAVATSAVIDSGARQVVLVAKGEGRFEPRPVTIGRRGEDYVEVLKGLSKGEQVVTSATFLIDSESNLKAALQSFTQPEASK